MAAPIQIFRSLRHRDYRLLWTADIGSNVGEGMQAFLFAWLTLEPTDSVSQVGVVALLHGTAMLAALVFGGVVMDRLDRRKVLVASELLLMANIGVLAVLTATDSVQMWQVYIASALGGIAQAPTFPARVAIMGDVVEREDLTNAVALNMLLINASWVIGAPLAGVLIGSSGMGTALYVNSGIFLLGALPVLFIRRVASVRAEQAKSVWRDLAEGLRFVKSFTPLVSLFALVLLMAFFAEPYSQLLPAFGRDVLDLDALRSGLLLLMVGLGALTANFILASLRENRHTVPMFLGAVLLFIVSLFLFAITPWYGLSLVLLFLAGVGEFGFIALERSSFCSRSPRFSWEEFRAYGPWAGPFCSSGRCPWALLARYGGCGPP